MCSKGRTSGIQRFTINASGAYCRDTYPALMDAVAGAASVVSNEVNEAIVDLNVALPFRNIHLSMPVATPEEIDDPEQFVQWRKWDERGAWHVGILAEDIPSDRFSLLTQVALLAGGALARSGVSRGDVIRIEAALERMIERGGRTSFTGPWVSRRSVRAHFSWDSTGYRSATIEMSPRLESGRVCVLQEPKGWYFPYTRPGCVGTSLALHGGAEISLDIERRDTGFSEPMRFSLRTGEPVEA